MKISESLESARYMVDPKGNRTDVVIPFETWQTGLRLPTQRGGRSAICQGTRLREGQVFARYNLGKENLLMVLNKKIQEYIRKLPPSFQEEMLDYLEFLLAKAEREDKDWARLSLTSAMRGMEDEADLYALADLKVKYS
jgi:hypothetical protein